MFASVKSATLMGITGSAMCVEVHVGNGLPGFTIVGTPDEACRESRDRVRAAMLSCGFVWPSRRITVNLARSGLRKGGSGLDLAIAIGILVAEGVIPAAAIEGYAFVAELGLDGRLRSMPGVVPLVAAVGDVRVVAARGSMPAGLRLEVVSAESLSDVVAALSGESEWLVDDSVSDSDTSLPRGVDLADVKGQPVARFALEVSAAGGHHLLLSGPPGSGKTMLATRLPTLLPRLSGDDAVTATLIHSAAGMSLVDGVVSAPPFRAPHHSSSTVAMVGGGDTGMRPGEVSLASYGVLFLDEMGEFAPATLDALRQPLEEGVVRVARARASITLPAKFLLVGSTNPCPCGGGAPGSCVCDDAAISRYLRRLSGPLLDRFDLRVAVDRPDAAQIVSSEAGESSASVRARVDRVREMSLARGALNSDIRPDALDSVAPLSSGATAMLRDALESGQLTGRGYHRVRRVARTISDLRSGGDVIGTDDVLAALSLRQSLLRRYKVPV